MAKCDILFVVGKKKKSKEPPPPPPVGPWIYKLHLADNGIDGYSSPGKKGAITPLICMRLFRKLITHSKCLQELDLEDNLIGDAGGRELIEGLESRSACKFTVMTIKYKWLTGSHNMVTLIRDWKKKNNSQV